MARINAITRSYLKKLSGRDAMIFLPACLVVKVQSSLQVLSRVDCRNRTGHRILLRGRIDLSFLQVMMQGSGPMLRQTQMIEGE